MMIGSRFPYGNHNNVDHMFHVQLHPNPFKWRFPMWPITRPKISQRGTPFQPNETCMFANLSGKGHSGKRR